MATTVHGVGARQTVTIEPVTRVGGALGARVETDGDKLVDARIAGNFYRGFEPIIEKHDPRDAMPLASRMCGWCGSVNMTTTQIALEMASGLVAPPMAIALRNVAQCTEAIWVHAANLVVRAGPDYCGPVVRATTPWIWDAAVKTECRNANVHGFSTMAELMDALTPIVGQFWRDTIPVGRRVHEMMNIILGKFPHPSTLAPAGITTTLSTANFTEYYTRVYLAVDYVKRLVTLFDDLIDFLYDADERFRDLGVRPASFIHAGAWDDVRTPNVYEDLDRIGALRLARPGVVVDGQLVTDRLSDVHQGIEESVDHSFYEQLTSGGDTEGFSAKHPWFIRNIPRPSANGGRYSWCTSPRWRGEVLETSALGRLWLTATRSDFPPNDFIEPTGTSVRILVPMNFLPEMVVEWHLPQRANALERLRADAYGVAFSGLCAAINLLRAFELTRRGEFDTTADFKIPRHETRGVGLWESGRGMNVHWIRMAKGGIQSFQMIGPSTWNASPRDGAGKPGPLEEALIGSPVISQPANGNTGKLDALRVIHAFDPCMNCGSH